jgi:hypothetical protein
VSVIVLALLLASVPKPFSTAELDRSLEAAWRAGGVHPAAVVDDATYLRRIYLDLTGVIPPPEAVLAFAAERGPDKRARAVDRLISTRRFVDHWAEYWDRTLLPREVRDKVVDRDEFHAWLRSEIESNAPYDRFVRALITASGANAPPPTPASTPVNPAVNWLLRFHNNPTDLAGTLSRLFLGVRIQCAECHDHPTENWTQQDFQRFAACFSFTSMIPIGEKKPIMGIKFVELKDLDRPALGRGTPEMRAIRDAAPATLDGTDLSAAKNRREALADWITSPKNKWFARAVVNRLWSYFLGRGFFDPVDDLREKSPIEGAAVLDRLSTAFVESGYDQKALIRWIVTSKAYQLSSHGGTGKPIKLWSRYRLRPPAPEDLLESLIRATNLESAMLVASGGNLDRFKAQMKSGLVFIFDVDETEEQTTFEGTIPQMLLLLNGSLIHNASSVVPGTALDQLLELPVGDESKIEALYLRTLSRKPSPAETAHWMSYLSAPSREAVTTTASTARPTKGGKGNPRAIPDPVERAGGRLATRKVSAKDQAYEDLFWALLNSSEFFFRH